MCGSASTSDVVSRYPRPSPNPTVTIFDGGKHQCAIIVGGAVHHRAHYSASDPTEGRDDATMIDGREYDEPKMKGRGGVIKTFPIKLHDMLDNIEADGNLHICSWQPHGRCFVVHDHKRFTEIVMPKYFKQTKFASFQRQLNLYSFDRFTQGRDKGGYYHKLFVRGQRKLCAQMMRIKVKGTKVRKATQPQLQPDFYSMPPAMALPAMRRSPAAPTQQINHRPPQKQHQPKQVELMLPCEKRSVQAVSQPKPDQILSKNSVVPPPLRPLPAPSKEFPLLTQCLPPPPASITPPLKPLAPPPSSSHISTVVPMSASTVRSALSKVPPPLLVLPPSPCQTPTPVPSTQGVKDSTEKNSNETKTSSSSVPPLPIVSKDVLPQAESLAPQTVDFLTGLFRLEANPHELPSLVENSNPGVDYIPPAARAFEVDEHMLFFEGKPFYCIEETERGNA